MTTNPLVLLMEITVSGPATGKGRPIFRGKTRDGHPIMDYPKTVKQQLDRFKVKALYLWRRRPPHQGPVAISVEVIIARPQRLKNAQPGRLIPDKRTKPDNDNAEGLVWDALVKAGVLGDDSWVVDNRCVKRYAAQGEGPSTSVRLFAVRVDVAEPSPLLSLFG